MIILENTIPGYNNRLKVATKDMKFDLNNINYYYGTINNPKKVHQEIQSHNLDTFAEPKKQVYTVNNNLEKLGE